MSYTHYLAAYLPAADDPAGPASRLPILVAGTAATARTAAVSARLPLLAVAAGQSARTVQTVASLPIGSLEIAAVEKVGGSQAVTPIIVGGSVDVSPAPAVAPPGRGRPVGYSYSGRVTVH